MDYNYELNKKLVNACTAEKPDYVLIERLLQEGARPLGLTDPYEKFGDFAYNEIIDHYLLGECPKDFVNITELFIKYGMDISKPDVSYDHENIINPLWLFAFNAGEYMIDALKLLLDNGLDEDSAGECWSHADIDQFLHGELANDFDYELFYDTLYKIMLIASYPHVLIWDQGLREVIWLSENDYDLEKFRDWRNYRFEVDTSHCKKKLNSDEAIVTIVEKESGKAVWKLSLGLKPDEVSFGGAKDTVGYEAVIDENMIATVEPAERID